MLVLPLPFRHINNVNTLGNYSPDQDPPGPRGPGDDGCQKAPGVGALATLAVGVTQMAANHAGANRSEEAVRTRDVDRASRARSVPALDVTRSQALALGRVETSLYHLCRWPKCSVGLSFAQAEKSMATMPLMSAIVKCGPQTNSLSARRASSHAKKC